jgi:hypothetical protein
VVIELAGDAQFARDLAVGGVFVPGCTLRLTDECELIVRGPAQQISLPARVVYVEGNRGAGLELIGFSSETKAQLAQLTSSEPQELIVLEEPPINHELSLASIDLARLSRLEDEQPINGPVELIDIDTLPGDDDLALTDDVHGGAKFFTATTAVHKPDDEAAHGTGDDDAETLPPPDDDPAIDDELADAFAAATGDGAEVADGSGVRSRRFARNVHERLRGLNLANQLKLASTGELHERIVLERLYGKNVWETLLRNPRLTAPEIARIARMGALPRVLLEIIITNNAWLQVPEVRRALLGNPRLATDQIVKVLRLTPKHELRLAAVQTAYPFAVRNAAKMLLRAGE